MYVEYGYNTQENQDNEARKGLAKQNRFTPDDLAENAKGRISSKQMITLFAKGVVPLLGLIIPALGLVLLGIALYLMPAKFLLKISFLKALGKYVFAGIGAFFCGILGILAKTIMASSRLGGLVIDVAQGKAAHAVGRVSVSRSDEVEDGINQVFNKKTLRYFYVIKDQYFEVSQEAHDEMQNQGGAGYYSVYHTPRSKFLLSIEPATGEQMAATHIRAA
jgi:hypothetical protein